MNDAQSDQVPGIETSQIHPYASAVILEHTGNDAARDFAELVKKLKAIKMRKRQGRAIEIAASGLVHPNQVLGNIEEGIEIDGFICKVLAQPGWAIADSPYTERDFDLVIALRQHRLFAIHCDSGLVEPIQKWLDKAPRPPFRRIPPGTINAALLTGEAKGLWLRGTHARRTTKADSKNISGRRLQDALSPLEDSTFAMGSARAELPAGEIFGTLSGTIGTTQRKSLVWIGPTSDFKEFLTTMRDLLSLFETTLNADASVDSPYPWLATEMQGASQVSHAYEMITLSGEDIPRTPDWPEEAIEAAKLLERAIIEVKGDPHGPDFVADVGLDGSFGGKIRCVVNDDNGVVRLAFGLEGQPTDARSVQMISDALRYTDLVTIYYESGHAVSSGRVWSAVVRPAPFPNWEWCDFSDYQINIEKPDGRNSQDIHDEVGAASDRSLFAWVLNKYGANGWLTCDDGPGEISDFVKYDGDGTVTLIHIKAAESTSQNRRIRVASYEKVVSQATKNLPYLNTRQLIERLSTPSVARPACWYNGARIEGRKEMIDFLEMRPAQAPQRVVIVQPQITKSGYERAFANDGGPTDSIRLALLETLLNSARGAVTGLGADLYVVGEL